MLRLFRETRITNLFSTAFKVLFEHTDLVELCIIPDFSIEGANGVASKRPLQSAALGEHHISTFAAH